MKTSTDRILTTHTGSLPRPKPLIDLILCREKGEAVTAQALEAEVSKATDDVVAKQVAAGIDVVSDGEMSKISYATYIRHRLTGFEGDSARPTPQDLDDVPEFRDKLVKEGASAKYLRPICKGPIKVKSLESLHTDIAQMKEALAASNAAEGFMNAVSPGTIAVFQPNEYYPSHEAYLFALADAMSQ